MTQDKRDGLQDLIDDLHEAAAAYRDFLDAWDLVKRKMRIYDPKMASRVAAYRPMERDQGAGLNPEEWLVDCVASAEEELESLDLA